MLNARIRRRYTLRHMPATLLQALRHEDIYATYGLTDSAMSGALLRYTLLVTTIR